MSKNDIFLDEADNLHVWIHKFLTTLIGMEDLGEFFNRIYKKVETTFNRILKDLPMADAVPAARKPSWTCDHLVRLQNLRLHGLLRVRPYFVEGPRQGHQKKFGTGSRSNEYCWRIDLDKFPEFGLRSVTDEHWEESFYPDGDSSLALLPAQDWVDPRKGELFAIVYALQEKEN